MLRVREWDRLYENNRSRELGQTRWFPMPNDLSAHRYVELVAHEDGATHFAVWVTLLMVASRATPRGVLVREDGRPHTPESLALITRLPQNVIEATIERLLKMNLLELSGDNPRKKTKLASHPDAARSQAAAVEPQESATEGKGIEHHHQEGNRTECEITLNHAARSRVPIKAKKPKASSKVRSSVSPSTGPDDDDQNLTVYASSDEELKAIYAAKTGGPITFEVLDAIRVNLELGGIAMRDFVAEVKRHTKNEWRNPPGFLRDLSKQFRLKTRTVGSPVTAAEAAEKNYRCPPMWFQCSWRGRHSRWSG
jgi:hypothetical protein